MNIIAKQVYWYISQISGERLQNHWSSSIMIMAAILTTVLHRYYDVGSKLSKDSNLCCKQIRVSISNTKHWLNVA